MSGAINKAQSLRISTEYKITCSISHTPISALENLTDINSPVAPVAFEVPPSMQWASMVLCLSDHGAFPSPT